MHEHFTSLIGEKRLKNRKGVLCLFFLLNSGFRKFYCSSNRQFEMIIFGTRNQLSNSKSSHRKCPDETMISDSCFGFFSRLSVEPKDYLRVFGTKFWKCRMKWLYLPRLIITPQLYEKTIIYSSFWFPRSCFLCR